MPARVVKLAQGQNRAADTGIFNANEINTLVILLAQAIRVTVRRNQVDSIACVSLVKTAEFRWCTAGVPRIRQKPIRHFYQRLPSIQPSGRALRACGGQHRQPLEPGKFAGGTGWANV